MVSLKVTTTKRNDSLGPKILKILDQQRLKIGLAIACYRSTGKVATALGSGFKVEVGKNKQREEIVRISTLLEGNESIIDIPLNIVEKHMSTPSSFSGYTPMVERI